MLCYVFKGCNSVFGGIKGTIAVQRHYGSKIKCHERGKTQRVLRDSIWFNFQVGSEQINVRPCQEVYIGLKDARCTGPQVVHIAWVQNSGLGGSADAVANLVRSSNNSSWSWIRACINQPNKPVFFSGAVATLGLWRHMQEATAHVVVLQPGSGLEVVWWCEIAMASGS